MPTRRQLDPQVVTVCFPEDGGQMGGINKEQLISRWVTDQDSFDDLINFLPTGNMLQQVPANGPNIAALPAPAVWISAQTLNAATYIFALGTNGGLYQVSLGGVVTVVSTAGSVSINTDIANWQGTTILFSDLNAAKIYSWNGTTFATVFSSQPAQFITVYNSRLWMCNQATVTFTAGGSFNSLGGDSGSFIMTDYDTPPPIRAIYPFGGNLFLFGYNWVQTISGLFDSGSPAVLQFSKITLTDEAGLINKWSVLPFGYGINYCSLYGIWSLLGAQPNFISENVGALFQGAFTNSSYSAAYGQVLGVPCLLWNLQSSDGLYRVIGQTINSQGSGPWFTVSIGSISFITYGPDQTNGQQKVFGTDTSGNLFQLFAGTGSVVSSLKTPLWSLGNRLRYKSIIRVGHEVVVTGAAIMAVTVTDQDLNQYSPQMQSVNPSTTFTWTNNAAVFNWTNGGGLPFIWTTNQTQYSLMDYETPITCVKIGINTSLTATGAAILSSAIEYQELPADWGN